jgi:hypothetical protein
MYSTASTFAFGGSIGTVQVSGNTVLHAGNYSTYSPSYGYFDDYTRGNYRVIADYGGYSTWYIRPDGRWVFARGHDWTVSFDLNRGLNSAKSTRTPATERGAACDLCNSPAALRLTAMFVRGATT